MKKFLFLLILTYLFVTLNSTANTENKSENLNKEVNILKIGVLVPLSGEFKWIGKSILNSIKLAVFDLKRENIKIFPKDSKGTAEGAFRAAQEFESMGIKIVVGPVFYESLSKLEKFKEIIFFSLTNKTYMLPSNTIAFGISFVSQLETIEKYLKDNNLSKTLLLIPRSEFEYEFQKVLEENKFEFFKKLVYETNPQKITSQIEKITNYNQRKINLTSRKAVLKNSELLKDQRELKKLEGKYTLGNVEFDSVIVADFGERLKSVLSSFTFADVSNKDVQFLALNQWFDEKLFNENSTKNLIFPSIELKSFNQFRKKYFEVFNEVASEISILAYDNVGLIYYIWKNKKLDFKINQLNSKEGFVGLQGEFFIIDNLSFQKLIMYKVLDENFEKIN